ncbi:hypothetical protein ACFFKU_02885 [Kineococcus gynurae]|uniref:Uncharacterized protein n=1 Tax=Kineococcus gynurae TaxID=452979 RepID=A0ABV5LS99_9ACTN
MWSDQDTFASPSGLGAEALGEALVRAFEEVGGGRLAAVELLRRTGTWLSELDRAGFVSVGAPHPDDPDSRPRAVIRWGGAVEAVDWDGPLHHEARTPGRDPFLLLLAAALAGRAPAGFNLGAGLEGLDQDTARFVLAAFSEATRAHSERSTGRRTPGEPVVAWPEEPPTRARETGRPAAAPVRERATREWVETHPAPVVSLPLAAPVRSVLEQLRSATRMRPVGGAHQRHQEKPLFSTFVLRPDEEVEEWLDFSLTQLAPLDDVGHDRRCFTRAGGPLPVGGATEPAEPDQVEVYWIPRDVAPEQVCLSNPDELSIVHLRIDLDPDGEDGEDGAGAPGDRTTVTIRDVRYSVQRSGERRTRVAWRREDRPRRPSFAMNVPLAPVDTVELLLRSPRL